MVVSGYFKVKRQILVVKVKVGLLQLFKSLNLFSEAYQLVGLELLCIFLGGGKTKNGKMNR